MKKIALILTFLATALLAEFHSPGRTIVESIPGLLGPTPISLPDGGEWKAPSGIVGWGRVIAGNGVAVAEFTFKKDGTVILSNPLFGLTTSNVGTINDVDGRMNIYNGGSGIVIENQLGSEMIFMIEMHYTTP